MRMLLLAGALALLMPVAEAQINKCVIDGRHTWQSAPCPPGTAEEGSKEESGQGAPQASAPSPAPAPAPQPARPPTKQERCANVAQLAETVMQQRQRGASMRELMSRVPDNDVARRIIMAAYEEPRYNTREYQQNEIRDFENKYFLECMRGAN